MRIFQIMNELFLLIFKTKPWKREKFVSKENAILVRQSLERLGSVFVKLGQMLALRPDIVPDVFCYEFYKLLDNVPPFDATQVETILQKELTKIPSKLFQNFDFSPVASASFAQVHKAVLPNGDMVAIKIQRPHIHKLVQEDLAIMRFLAKTFGVLFKPSNELMRIVEEFESWTKEELDYTLEASHIRKFNYFAKLLADGIRAPKIYSDLSTSKVLTMEYIEGYSLIEIVKLQRNKNVQKLEKMKFNGKEVIHKLIRNMLEMFHIHGFFHADPHLANIIFTPDQKLVFIDFGIVGNLSKKERILILRYFRTLLAGNAEESLASLTELCGDSPSYNFEELKNEYQRIVTRFIDTFDAKTYLEQQKRSGPILIEALNLLQKNGFKVPVSIVRYFKAFETVEGLIFVLYPELQIKEMAREFRRVSIVNIVDSLPNALGEKSLNNFISKLIDSLEKSLLLNN